MKLNTLWSVTRSIGNACESVPKKSAKSASTIHSDYPSCRQMRCIAIWTERPG